MNLRLPVIVILVSMIFYVNGIPDDSFETVHTSNAAVLNRLGLTSIDIPEGHHKKRVAGPEPPSFSTSIQSRIHQPYSRRHGHRDSHVFVVKLPASQPYYTVTKPHKSMNKDDKIITPNKSGGAPPPPPAADGPAVIVATNSLVHQSPSVGFHSNGKPAKIYHWNLPVMKRIKEKKRQHAQMYIEQMRKNLPIDKKFMAKQQLPSPFNDIKFQPDQQFKPNSGVFGRNEITPGFKHTRNNDKLLNYPETRDHSRKVDSNLYDLKKVNDSRKFYKLDSSPSLHKFDSHPNTMKLPSWNIFTDFDKNSKFIGLEKPKKHKKKAIMSYYAPITTKTGPITTNIHKNFPGNGKPKAFYVMEKSRKPAYYHPLLP